MDEQHLRELIHQAAYRTEILGERLAILGATSAGAEIVGALKRAGLGELCVGIFDHRGESPEGARYLPLERIVDFDFDTLIVADDAGKEDLLGAYKHVDARLPDVVISGTAHFEYRNPDFDSLLHSSVGVSLANGYPYSLVHLYQCLEHAARNGLEGDIAEFGVFKGGTTLLLAKFAEHLGLAGARIFGFDTFGGFPPRWSVLDLYSRPGCVFTDVDAVRTLCSRHDNVELVIGDIVETHTVLRGRPLILSFFDTDNYSPARAALETCMAETVVGGAIVFDHFTSIERFRYTIGERMAAREVLETSGFFHLHGTGVFIRTGASL